MKHLCLPLLFRKICYIIVAILLIFSMTSCGLLKAIAERELPVEESIEDPLASATDAAESSETLPAEPLPTEPEHPESIPQSGAPVTPQPGDTGATWDPERAATFPDDAGCTDSELLEKWLTAEGLSYADLDARNCGQLLLVSAQETDGVQTLAVCYERQPDGSWQPAGRLGRMNGHVGYNGIQHNRKRFTYRSPAGLWGLGIAFGNAEKPEGLKMPWRDVTPNSEWVGDADSLYFNTWQERGDPALLEDWNHEDGEHLQDYTELYAYAVAVLYNTPPYTIPERGCAIFLHCSEGGTGGCIGLQREDMLRVLLWLDPEKSPCILVTGYERPD